MEIDTFYNKEINTFIDPFEEKHVIKINDKLIDELSDEELSNALYKLRYETARRGYHWIPNILDYSNLIPKTVLVKMHSAFYRLKYRFIPANKRPRTSDSLLTKKKLNSVLALRNIGMSTIDAIIKMIEFYK